MSRENLNNLINEYKETEESLEKYMDLLEEKDYARGKLDLVKSIIADLEKLKSEV